MVQKSDSRIKCPKCFKQNFWQAKDGRLKCKGCRYIFTLKKNIFNIKNETLEQIILEFLLGHSTNIILQRIKISKYKLLQILTYLRKIMTRDIPEPLNKKIKIEENYFDENFSGRSKRKRPVIGILCYKEKVYAKILSNIKPSELKDFIKSQQVDNTELNINWWQKNMALVFKNKLYKLYPSEDKNYQIDALESFWGYLKRKLAAKGGIRKEKFFLYLGEYVWKYNHRKLSLEEQKNILLNKTLN